LTATARASALTFPNGGEAKGQEATATATLLADSPHDPRPGESHRLLDDLLAAIDGEVEQTFAALPADGDRAGRLSPAAAEEKQYVLFTLADTDYAVPIANVVELSRPLPITPVPNVPDWVVGVANVRGDIVSLVDFRTFLGLERPGNVGDQRLLVVRAREENMTTALLVDQVRGMRRLSPQSLSVPAAPIQGRIASYLGGVSDHEGRLVAVLDLDRLLLSAEMRQFEPAN
jgi:purine-binding chemotaxis protein CheW